MAANVQQSAQISFIRKATLMGCGCKQRRDAIVGVIKKGLTIISGKRPTK